MNPLKQGLKQEALLVEDELELNAFIHESIKTRVETIPSERDRRVCVESIYP